MRLCKALPIWLNISLVLCVAGCAAFDTGEEDPLYSVYGSADAEDGLLSQRRARLLAKAKAQMGFGPNEARASELFEQAMGEYRIATKTDGPERKKLFQKAAKSFARAGERWPGSSIEEDAMFHRAESLFFANLYPKAEDTFAQLVKEYANTKYIETVSQRRFELAKYWLDHYQHDKDLPMTPNLAARDRPLFDKFGHGIRVLEQIRLDDPTGELADDATMLAASACFQDGRYYRADEFLNDLRQSFPSSEHQYAAHMLGLRCKTELYRGPSYDAGPLDAAEQLVKQMRRQFPAESQKDTELLAQAWKDIRMNRAIREMNLAKYRDRRHEYRAARTQYAKVARDFSDTSLALQADERLAELGGLPDLPPQRLQWLANILPSDEEDQPLLATRPEDSKR